MPRSNRRYKITANLFGIPLGLCGLAQCWTTAGNLDITPGWPADVLWATAAAVWMVVAAAYFGRYHRPTDLAGQLADPKFGPFVPVSALVPVLLSSALARHAPTAGHVLFWAALVVTLLFGGWLFGQWTLSAPALLQWHPGYFLPTVGGGLISAIVALGIGERSLGQLLSDTASSVGSFSGRLFDSASSLNPPYPSHCGARWPSRWHHRSSPALPGSS